MSLNLDDWLKPSDEETPETSNPVVDVGDDEDPITNSLTAADLQLPDLGLPDIKWWIDLEFLDLASGPPANFNSNQEKNKNKHNPTLGYHFPDIFFDTTAGQGTHSSTSNLFGSADDTHRSLIGDQTFENFEKGLLNLADLFPTTSTGNMKTPKMYFISTYYNDQLEKQSCWRECLFFCFEHRHFVILLYFFSIYF